MACIDAVEDSLAGHEDIPRTERDGTASNTFTDEFHGVSNASSEEPRKTNTRLLQYLIVEKQLEKGLADESPTWSDMKSTEKHGLSHKGQSDKYEAESMMETIDLSDEVKLDESHMIVDSKLLNTATSFWPNSRRSYKKLLKDAFTSRRRLRKEYEQLTIMYGDFDAVSEEQSSPVVLPRTITADQEWELL